MDRTVSQAIGVIMVFVPLLIWSLDAFGLLGVGVPQEHFATLIWAGVSLILGYNAKAMLEGKGEKVKKAIEDEEKEK